MIGGNGVSAHALALISRPCTIFQASAYGGYRKLYAPGGKAGDHEHYKQSLR